MNQADDPQHVPAKAPDLEDAHGAEERAELVRQFWRRMAPPIYDVMVAPGTLTEPLNWD